MNISLITQIILIFISLFFIYIGAMTIFSKDYFFKKWKKNNPDRDIKKYKDLELSSIIYSRYGWGGQWLLLGVGLLALIVYGFFKL